jgi:chaperonin cofactor prefoldin
MIRIITQWLNGEPISKRSRDAKEQSDRAQCRFDELKAEIQQLQEKRRNAREA